MEGSDWEIKASNECAKKLEAVNSALNTLLAGIDTEIKITLSRIRETNSQFFEGKLSGLTFCRDLLKKTGAEGVRVEGTVMQKTEG